MRLFEPIISFYSPTAFEEAEDVDYSFCSEKCINIFLENRKEFWNIVKDFNNE